MDADIDESVIANSAASPDYNKKQQYICNYCNQSFTLKCNLASHIRYHINEKPHTCDVCQQSYSTRSGLALHFKTHENSSKKSKKSLEGNRKFICSYCDKGFSLKSNLILHIRTHTGEKPFRCTYCNKTSATKYNLLSHIKTHYSQKTIKCDYCDKYFSSRKNLHSHVQIHISTKRYYCSYCDKSSIHKGTLKVHERIHTGEKPYKCLYCGKQFNHRSNLTHHVRIHTGERPFICKYCNKGFRQKYALDGHERIHTGAKPYVCHDCNKSFPYSASLRSHMKIHFGSQVFTCYYCMRSFASKISLSLHIRVHTCNKTAPKRKVNNDDEQLLRSALALQPVMSALHKKNQPKTQISDPLDGKSSCSDEQTTVIDYENPHVDSVLNILLTPKSESEPGKNNESLPPHDFKDRLRKQLCKFMDKYSLKNLANSALRKNAQVNKVNRLVNDDELISVRNARTQENYEQASPAVVHSNDDNPSNITSAKNEFQICPEAPTGAVDKLQFKQRLSTQLKTIVHNGLIKNKISEKSAQIPKTSILLITHKKPESPSADFQLKNHMNNQLKKLIQTNLVHRFDALMNKKSDVKNELNEVRYSCDLLELKMHLKLIIAHIFSCLT